MKGAILIIIIFFITGCSTEELKEMPVTQVTPRRIKTPTMKELPVSQVAEKVKEREKLYSLSVKDMDVRSVIFVFSKELPEYNIVVEPDVSGTVTVDFKNLPLEKALTFILEPLNLEYTLEENILVVSKPKLETYTYEFVYSPSTRLAKSALVAVTGGGGGGGGVEGEEGGRGSGRGGPVSTSFGSVETDDTINVWNELQTGIRELLSEEGKLVVNARVGYITVVDYRSNQKRVGDFIDFFKTSINKQILIRAKILEVTLDKGLEFGIDWSVVVSKLSTTLAITQPFAPLLGKPKAPTGQTRPNPIAELFQLGVTGNDFDFIVRALESQGKVRVLSAPEVSTLNGQTAIIRSVREDAVFQTTTTATSAGITDATTVEPFTFGVYLDVIPHVDSDGIITMFIHPSISSLVSTKRFRGAETPIIDTRETDTIVRVMGGETVIIAGLMVNVAQKSISKVPILGDIPYVGGAFRKDIESHIKSELVILISPSIVGSRAKDFVSVRKKYRMLSKQLSK
jgi:MSHA biogenesis protein MshL